VKARRKSSRELAPAAVETIQSKSPAHAKTLHDVGLGNPQFYLLEPNPQVVRRMRGEFSFGLLCLSMRERLPDQPVSFPRRTMIDALGSW
jgi:hypothetical protein